ncbi:fimbrial protein [Cronobacter turicensis]|nr:fimbrial protein [Cronobacter turicensis]ELY3626247.1 fimbrial protein [Cronobacter turicensis]
MESKMKAITSFALGLILSATAQTSLAEQTGDSMNITFQGKYIISTPCTVSNDKVMDISFGNISINGVNGVDHGQPIPYSVDCHGAPDDSPLSLMVTGSVQSFDDAAVVTSADGLGLQIQANGQSMKLNKPLNTTLGALQSLTLMAVPVKDPAKTLTEQPFTATATLTAQYQ